MVRLTISVKIITVRNYSRVQHVSNTLARIPHTLTSEHQTEQTGSISPHPCAQKSVDASSQAIRIHGKQSHRVNSCAIIRPSKIPHPSCKCKHGRVQTS